MAQNIVDVALSAAGIILCLLVAFNLYRAKESRTAFWALIAAIWAANAFLKALMIFDLSNH